jgi:hypothetical protein
MTLVEPITSIYLLLDIQKLFQIVSTDGILRYPRSLLQYYIDSRSTRVH